MPKGVGYGGGQAQPNPKPGGFSAINEKLTSFFPEQGSQAQTDMIMQLVQAGIGHAQSGGSPLANFLAPVAGAAIGGRAQRKRDDARSEKIDELTKATLGDFADNPAVQGYLSTMNDPDAPAHLKSIAQSRLNSIINPKKTGRGTGVFDGKVPGNTDALMARMFYNAIDPRGDGGPEITASEQAGLDALRNARSRYNPQGGSDFLNSTPSPQIDVDDKDPLGILEVPPA